MRHLILIGLALAALTGCEEKLTADEFYGRNEALELVYYTGTKEEAEVSLRKRLALMSEAETAGLKAADYDKLRFYIHLQLSRVAHAMADETLAGVEMAKAISYFRRTHAKEKKTDEELSNALTLLADAVEEKSPPKWKKEAQPGGTDNSGAAPLRV